MAPSDQPPALPPEPPPPVRWRSWPLRDDVLRAVLLVIGLLLVAGGLAWLSGAAYLGALAMAALLVALWRFFLPVVFELSGEGVSQRLFGRPRLIPWRAVRRYEVRRAGVLLLPDENRSPLAPLRGLYLPWTTHRDEVLAHVGHYLERPRQTQDFVAGHGGV